MRAAARLAPNEVLSALGQLQQTCLDMASRGNSAAAEVRAGGPGVSASVRFRIVCVVVQRSVCALLFLRPGVDNRLFVVGCRCLRS